jgi:hypothetical protein
VLPNKVVPKMTSITESTPFSHTWVLWYFDPRNKDWSLSNYKKIADISTAQQLWTIISAIPREAWECGYFFFMKRGFRPIWEVPENEHGGSWSKKIPTCDMYDIAVDLIVHSIAAEDNIMLTRHDAYVGFSTSPKGDFNIVKLWTNSVMAGSAKTHLNVGMKMTITDDVVYTAHKSRR